MEAIAELMMIYVSIERRLGSLTLDERFRNLLLVQGEASSISLETQCRKPRDHCNPFLKDLLPTSLVLSYAADISQTPAAVQSWQAMISSHLGRGQQSGTWQKPPDLRYDAACGKAPMPTIHWES